MELLRNKNIVIGVTGGIAAYKSAELTRILCRNGINVKVVMTDSAREFVTPLTFQALSGQKVHTDLFDLEAEAAMGHIELARWADLFIVAPASADFISILATGRADTLLSTILLATEAPIYLAPAMNQLMWNNQATRDNVQTLKYRGFRLVGPVEGEQACGDLGYGRMSEPEDIAATIIQYFFQGALIGKHVLITAGPTREKIDPVRFISNYSSGKMGFALATAAAEVGATVTLVTGPVSLNTPRYVKRINIESASEMQQVVHKILSNQPQDIYISNAAIADFKPLHIHSKKLKKDPNKQANIDIFLELTRTPDILNEVSELKNNRPFIVGFAAESHDTLSNGKKKLQHKNLDMIIINDINKKAIGFNSDDNEVTVMTPDGATVHYPRMSKIQLARKLINMISRSVTLSTG